MGIMGLKRVVVNDLVLTLNSAAPYKVVNKRLLSYWTLPTV